VNDEHGAESVLPEWLEQSRALIRSARFDNAAVLLEAQLEQPLEPGYAREARYLLAVARRYSGAPQDALKVIDALLAEAPEYGRAHQERGHALMALQRAGDAAHAYARAVELNPGLLASWKALRELHAGTGRADQARMSQAQIDYLHGLPAQLRHVIDLLHEGKLYKAEQLCRRFLLENKHHVEGMRLLAELGIRLKIYDDAEFLLESCVELAPGHVPARTDYLNLLNRKARFDKALEQAQILLRDQPDNPVFETAMATALVGVGRLEEGIARYEKVLRRAPEKAAVHLLLGHARKAAGDFDGAVRAYRAACRIRVDYGDAYWSLANTKKYQFAEAEVAEIERQASRAGVVTQDRIHLCFAAGKAFEDRGEYATSFAYYERGNALRREQSTYDPERVENMVRAQISTCTRELFQARRGAGCTRADPIFIVGLPRAGSTLLEQILASHSMVDGTMELHEILRLAQRLGGRSTQQTSRYPQILWELDEEYFHRFGDRYLADTQAYRGGAAFFTDKMPNNFLHIGLIRLILPNAKVIDARRHPLACCFSGFKQLFGEGQEFSYSLEWLGRYYRAYVELMDHWDRVLPGFVLRVMHEDVVADLETQVRRILAFCNLPFEPACLRFNETRRSIRTPSSEQVRQGIEPASVGHWRNYQAYLGPLETALGPAILKRYPCRPA